MLNIQIINDITKLTGVKTGKCYQIKICVNNCWKIEREIGFLDRLTPHSLHIFDAPFLLQDDEAWFGKKPFRTYYGAKYVGGFSDHLPVYMDLKF